MTPDINYLAVVVAAIAAMVLGFVWYGPLFGKPWMQLMGFTKDTIDQMKGKGMTKNYVLMMVGALVMAYVLAHALEFASDYTQTFGVTAGVMVGFLELAWVCGAGPDGCTIMGRKTVEIVCYH